MRTQFGKEIRESDVCVLCGQRPATTKEHIPPRSLFLEKPAEYLTVPACEKCNSSTMLADDDLRMYMAFSSRTEEGLAMHKAKVRPRLFERPATKAGLRERLTRFPADIPNLGRVMLPAITSRPDRFRASAEKMVRGLYWWHSGRTLGQDVPIRVNLLNIVQIVEFFKNEEHVNILKRTSWGVYRDSEVVRTFSTREQSCPRRCRSGTSFSTVRTRSSPSRESHLRKRIDPCATQQFQHA